jgi:hypothetical protein
LDLASSLAVILTRNITIPTSIGRIPHHPHSLPFALKSSMTDYYVYMMVLELVAIAHAVLTDPQHGRRLCKPGGANLCGDRYQFRLERDDVQWPRPRLAACTMRTTPGNAPSCELHVPLAPPLETPSGMIWLGSVLSRAGLDHDVGNFPIDFTPRLLLQAALWRRRIFRQTRRISALALLEPFPASSVTAHFLTCFLTGYPDITCPRHSSKPAHTWSND